MTKQDDALAALASGGITERAEAVRELGRVADISVLDTLLTSALGDKSPGVRLAAASAAADVLARYRLPPGRAEVNDASRSELLRQLRSIDPGRNTGLFQVMACLGEPAVVRNLARGVRDPRVDVRTGALVGLERLMTSGSVNGDPRMAKALDGLLDERRIRSDALLELARLAWRTGQWQLRPKVEALAARLEPRWLPALQELLEEFSPQLGSEHLLGCWLASGLDCGEQRVVRAPPTVLIVLPSTLLVGPGGALGLARWSLEDGALTCSLLAEGQPQATRVLRSWYAGQEGTEVLQLGPVSYGRMVEKELPDVLDRLSAQDLELQPVARQLLALLEPQLSQRAAGVYTTAVLRAVAGDRPAALEAFEGLASAKRPRAEVFWHIAALRRRAGEPAQAKASAERYLEAAKPKSPFLEVARKLVG